MNPDIGPILDAWPFDPTSNVRQFQDAGGAAVLQVRVAQGPFRGILQMNLDGRPDAEQPHGCEFALDHYEGELAEQLAADGRPGGFRLDEDACAELFDESSRVYERYTFLLRLADFQRVVRDTERNMRLFRFVHQHAEREEDRMRLERWWPYILRINATARAMLAMTSGRRQEALDILREARERIVTLDEVDAVEFHAERQRSLEALDELADEVAEQAETKTADEDADSAASPADRLQQQLNQAVAREDFERAAELRDQLRELQEQDRAW